MTKNKLLLLLALLMTAATGAMAADTYTVAGSNSAMFGFAWDPSNTANDMTKNGDGTYSITYTNVNFTEPEEVQYKVVKDHSWNEAYPEVNRVINIAKAGTYTLTIHFNPTTHEVYETMPGYTVTLADGTEEPTLWSASPATDVKKGQTVTVTYTGAKKVIGVKAEKKGATTSTQLSAATTDDIGKVVCAAGHLHDAKTAVPDGCTAVGILGKVTETGHGLILALQDAPQQTWNIINGWTSASYAGTTLKVLPNDDARGTNLTSYTTLGSTAVSNWAVAQKSDYEAIFTNLGSTMGDEYGKTYDDHVEAYITTGVGGAAISGAHWSATEDSDTNAFVFYPYYYWYGVNKTNVSRVRPVLGF